MSPTKIRDTLSMRLSRVTASSLFIPEIDGLRFLAIFMVVLFHVNQALIGREQFTGSYLHSPFFFLIDDFFNTGPKGVLLFFVISGFIIALPFAKHFLNKEKAVNIKSYFTRRLTRIEPPYLINTIACFLYLVFRSKYALSKLWPSFVAALFYLNNNFHLGVARVNPVVWSLEIEIQFYIIAPLLCYIFVVNKNARRVLLLSLIILFPLIHALFSKGGIYQPAVKTLYSFIQYFLAGILLADLYIDNFKIVFSKSFSIIVGISLLLIMAYVDYSTFIGQILLLFSVLFFSFLVLNDVFWGKVFSVKYLTIIGGMCYSIYLWHYVIIDAVIKFTVFIKITNDYLITMAFQSFLILPIILALSSLFYVLVERPCMDKKWPVNLMHLLKKVQGPRSQTKPPGSKNIHEP